MNTQRVRAFTLVELIVVITILVILGTIAFLNLGSFSASARDSQRTSDLNQINSQIMTTQARNGTAYSAMITADTASLALTAASVAGVSATGSLYAAGDVNYSLLGIDSNKMQDPIKKTPYRMAQTTLGGGAYEVAASLEAYNGGTAGLVMGVYRPRVNTNTTETITTTVGANATSLAIPTPTKLALRVGDTVTGSSTGSGVISAISSDFKTITLSSSTLANSTTTIQLAATEATGLNASGSTTPNNFSVTNYGTVLPY